MSVIHRVGVRGATSVASCESPRDCRSDQMDCRRGSGAPLVAEYLVIARRRFCAPAQLYLTGVGLVLGPR
jgi:hypothetical protein